MINALLEPQYGILATVVQCKPTTYKEHCLFDVVGGSRYSLE